MKHRHYTARDFLLPALLIALAMLVSFWTGQAHAQPPSGNVSTDLTWIAPTTDTSGATLQLGDLTGYAVYIGTQSRFSSGATLRAACKASPASAADMSCYASTRAVTSAAATSFTFTHTLTFTTPTVTAVYAMAALGKNGGISPYSNEATKQFTANVPVNPQAPTTVTVTVTVTCTPQPCTVTVSP